MTGDAVEDTDWERVVFQYVLAGMSSDTSSHFLASLVSNKKQRLSDHRDVVDQVASPSV
jgi:hypothetical protein